MPGNSDELLVVPRRILSSHPKTTAPTCARFSYFQLSMLTFLFSCFLQYCLFCYILNWYSTEAYTGRKMFVNFYVPTTLLPYTDERRWLTHTHTHTRYFCQCVFVLFRYMNDSLVSYGPFNACFCSSVLTLFVHNCNVFQPVLVVVPWLVMWKLVLLQCNWSGIHSCTMTWTICVLHFHILSQ